MVRSRIDRRKRHRSRRFYDAALQPLGYHRLSEGAASLGYGDAGVGLWIGVAKRPVPADEESGLHFCFTAPTRQSIDAFHAVASAPWRAR